MFGTGFLVLGRSSADSLFAFQTAGVQDHNISAVRVAKIAHA